MGHLVHTVIHLFIVAVVEIHVTPPRVMVRVHPAC